MRNGDDRDANKGDAGKSSSVLARREFLKTTGAVVVGISAVQRTGAQAQNVGATAW